MMQRAPSGHHDACELHQALDGTDVGLFRSSAPTFAVEGESGSQIRIGVLLRGMVRTESRAGLLVSDARESPRIWVLPAGTSYAVTAIPGHAPVILGATLQAGAFARYVEGAMQLRVRAPEIPMVVDEPVAALGIEAFHRSLWSGATSLEWESWLVTSLRRLFTHSIEARERSLAPAASSEPRAVARVREHLHAHYAESIPLERLAAIAGVSKYHLVRSFRAAVGAPPHTYQLRLRLTRSLFLLRQGLSASAIAYELGFADQSHFTRAFRVEFGTTPGAWIRGSGAVSSSAPRAVTGGALGRPREMRAAAQGRGMLTSEGLAFDGSVASAAKAAEVTSSAP